jgi:hypothetical protein
MTTLDGIGGGPVRHWYRQATEALAEVVRYGGGPVPLAIGVE